MYRQALVKHNLSVEQGTPAVPDDGQYYVVSEGNIVGGFKSLKRALACYNNLKAALDIKRTPPAKPTTEDLLRLQMETMSNKALIWSEEDFVRVQRKTQGKKGTRSAG